MQSNEKLPNETDDQHDIRLHKDIAAFSYLWIMSIVVYIVKKDSKFVRHHAKQGIILFLLSIPLSLLPVVGRVGLFFIVAGMLLGFVHAAQGQYRDLPLIGDLAKGNLSVTDVTKSVFRSLRRGVDALEKFFHQYTSPKSSPKKDSTIDTNT